MPLNALALTAAGKAHGRPMLTFKTALHQQNGTGYLLRPLPNLDQAPRSLVKV